MNREDIVAELRALRPELASRYKAKSLGLFGSSAGGDPAGGGDVDLLVDFEEGADLFDMVGMSLFLEDKLHRRVDVVSQHTFRRNLRAADLGEVVAI
jgi:predicted nucleotidyltransferase